MTIGHSLLAVSMTTVLLAVIAGSPSLALTWLSAALRVPALRSVGKFSYAMYVFHIPLSILVGAPLLPALKRLGAGYPVWYAIWIAACSYLAAMASYHLLEKHFLIAHVWIGHIDRNLDIAARYGVPLHHGVPALAVLSPSGKVLYSQATGEFSDMRHMEADSVTAFLNRWKN